MTFTEKKTNKTFLIMGYLILFPVNHSRPALMGCSVTTSKLVLSCEGSFQLASDASSGHVKDFLHTKHLVLSYCMFLKQSFHDKNTIDASQMEVSWWHCNALDGFYWILL